MSIRGGVAWYYSLFGIRGVLAGGAHRVFGRPKEIRAHLPGLRSPVYARIGTTDELVYRDVLLETQYSFDLPSAPKTIVDAGANIGATSIYFAKRYPEARIVAIEAEPSNFVLLSKNVRPYPSIEPVHAALWGRDGQISVREPDPATGAFGQWGFITQEGPGCPVRSITMRTLMRNMSLPHIDLLKVDIEGAEKEVFESCDWIDNVGCLMIELHDRFKPGCSDAVNRVLKGFSRFQQRETTLFVRGVSTPGPRANVHSFDS